MIRLLLTCQEAEALHKILTGYLAHVSSEVAALGADKCEVLGREERSTRSMIGYLEDQGVGTPAEIFGGYAE